MLNKALETNSKSPPIDRKAEQIIELEKEIERMRILAWIDNININVLLEKIKELEMLKNC